MAKMFFYCPRTSSLAGQIVLEWCGRAYQLCRVPYEELHGADYLQINPRGKVPSLKVGDRVVRENIAILTYLARRGKGTPLMADYGTPAADAELEWLSFLATEVAPLFLIQFGASRFAESDATQAELVAGARTQLSAKLAELDAQIGERSTVTGDTKTILDALFFAMLRWCDAYVDFEKDLPNVHRFQQTMLADPGVQRALEIESADVADIETTGALRKHIVITDLFKEPAPEADKAGDTEADASEEADTLDADALDTASDAGPESEPGDAGGEDASAAEIAEAKVPTDEARAIAKGEEE